MEDVPSPPRPPEQADLVSLCRELNERGARYIVVGGMAIIQQGFVRATEDIDLLIEKSQGNQERVRAALETLPDKAVREMTPTDLENYLVVRVLDEIVVDLMLQACGISYDEAEAEIERVVIDGVEIPFASAQLLWKMKQTVREKDELDRQFLRMKLSGKE
jgi:hypothetical protein